MWRHHTKVTLLYFFLGCSYHLPVLLVCILFYRLEIHALLCNKSELFRLLGFYAAYGGMIPTFRDHLTVPYSLIGSPKTSVSNCRAPRNNPADGRIHFNRGGSLRWRRLEIYLNSMKQKKFKYASCVSLRPVSRDLHRDRVFGLGNVWLDAARTVVRIYNIKKLCSRLLKFNKNN